MKNLVNKCFDTLGAVNNDKFSDERINNFISKNQMTENQKALFIAFIQIEKSRRNI